MGLFILQCVQILSLVTPIYFCQEITIARVLATKPSFISNYNLPSSSSNLDLRMSIMIWMFDKHSVSCLLFWFQFPLYFL